MSHLHCHVRRFSAEKVRTQNEKHFADQGTLFYDLKGKAWYRGGKQKRNFALEKRKEKELAVRPHPIEPLGCCFAVPSPPSPGSQRAVRYATHRRTSKSRTDSTRKRWCVALTACVRDPFWTLDPWINPGPVPQPSLEARLPISQEARAKLRRDEAETEVPTLRLLGSAAFL